MKHFTNDLFSKINIGNLGDFRFISRFSMDHPEYVFFLNTLFYNYTTFDPKINSTAMGFNGVLLWFKALEQLDDNDTNYFSWVTMESSSFIAKKELDPVLQLWVEDQAFWCYDIKAFSKLNDKTKKNNLLLAAAMHQKFKIPGGDYLKPTELNYQHFVKISDI